MLRALLLLGAALAGLACAGSTWAHEGGGHSGFVATVSTIDPPQLGLLVDVLGGHERLSVRNLTRKTVVIFGEDGRPTLRLAPGRSGSMPDLRIGSTGPPPKKGEFVKNWRIPGEADGQPFEIVGFLGYRAPPGNRGRLVVPRLGNRAGDRRRRDRADRRPRPPAQAAGGREQAIGVATEP